MRRFLRRDPGGDSYRFVSSLFNHVFLWVGTEGTPGERRSQRLADAAEADAYAERLAAEWVAEGFEEFVAPVDDGERTLARVLADAVADDPDDLAACMAEADYLAEQGDPRGEFIQVQLALEDESRSPAERDALQQRECDLLYVHEERWLGDLARHLCGSTRERRAAFLADLGSAYRGMIDETSEREGAIARHAWARGRLDSFECRRLTTNLARALGRHPIARSLRVLAVGESYGIHQDFPIGPDVPDLPSVQAVEMLSYYPVLRNVRSFRLGETADPERDQYHDGHPLPGRLASLLTAMPRLEELSLYGYGHRDGYAAGVFALPTLSNLRSLVWYHGQEYPLDVLANNPAASRLERLSCYPHMTADVPALDLARLSAVARRLTSLTHLQLRCCDAGDAGVAELIDSGAVGRLTFLDLRHGHVTDDGARMLAACPGATKLEVLDLTNNRLTPDGVEMLRRAGIRVRAERQQVPPFDDDGILYYGDNE